MFTWSRIKIKWANIKRYKFFFVLASLLNAPYTIALVEFYPNPFPTFDFTLLPLWGGYGGLTVSETNCIVSKTGNGYFGGQDRPYQLTVTMLSSGSASSGLFVFYNNLDNSVYVPVNIDVTDLHGSGSQTLSPNIPSANLTYNRYCTGIFGTGNGPNIQLSMSFTETELRQVPAGDYSVDLNVTATRVGDSDSDSQTLSGTLTIPDLVQVSNLDDINIPPYDGVSPVTASETFCVYSNLNGGNYTITPSSPTTLPSDPASFALTNGTDFLAYAVTVSDSPGGGSSSATLNNQQISPTFNTNQSIPYSVTCDNDGDNAEVTVDLDNADLQTAPPGNYSGTLNLMVAPI